MGFFIRKSKKFGLFNFNLSKSGIGASFGIAGIRTGIDANGRVYISGGKGMFRYRKYISTNSNKKINTDFNPDLNNLYNRSGLGLLWWWCQFILDIAQIIIILCCFMNPVITVYGNKDEMTSLFVFVFIIFMFYLMRQIHKFIFTPYFIKLVNIAGIYIKRDDYIKALKTLHKAKKIGENSTLYKITPNFIVIVDNLIKICEHQITELKM